MSDEKTTEIPEEPAASTPAVEAPAEPGDSLQGPGSLELYDLALRLTREALETAHDASGLIRGAYPEFGKPVLVTLLADASCMARAVRFALISNWRKNEVELLCEMGDRLAARARSIEARSPSTSGAFITQRKRLVALAKAGIAWELEAKGYRKRLLGDVDDTKDEAPASEDRPPWNEDDATKGA
jgi:hypothetical protein